MRLAAGPIAFRPTARKENAVLKKLLAASGCLLFALSASADGDTQAPPELTSAEALTAIRRMVLPVDGAGEIRIVNISAALTPSAELSAVVITPPYREFPNVILFSYDRGRHSWRRITEGLSLGLTADQSRFLDLHVAGRAVDIVLPAAKRGTSREQLQETLARIGIAQGQIMIPYQKFVHTHSSGVDRYFIDKSDYHRFAPILLPEIDWSGVARTRNDRTCILFDDTDIQDLSFDYDRGRFVLVAETSNGQRWTATFTGSDGERLLNLHIAVERHKETHEQRERERSKQ
jgi:hypothetical protein